MRKKRRKKGGIGVTSDQQMQAAKQFAAYWKGRGYEKGNSQPFRLADWNTMISNVFAKQAIRYLLNCENEKLLKETMFAFEMYE
ncbi:MAG: hypothetical protein Q4F17_06315 [Eubacteriales bacterium]|nr:hypothetical protein [Eubacteriales bacterium]